MILQGDNMNEFRIETRADVSTYLAQLKYALTNGAHISFQRIRKVDENRDIKYTNDFTMNELFPDEDPEKVLRTELMSLTVGDYLRTVKDVRFPQKSEMREFGKVYNGSDEVYIKIRVELFPKAGGGQHTAFVMSFHFAETPFSQENFPYRN